MKLSGKLQHKLKKQKITELDESDFLELRAYYRYNSKKFVNRIKRVLSRVKRKQELDNFFFIEEQLGGIFYEISVFISAELNRIFELMVDSHYYRHFVDYEQYIIACGNNKTLDLIKQVMNRRNILKVLERVDLYRLKKMALTLKEKLGIRNKRPEPIEMNIAPLKLDWSETV